MPEEKEKKTRDYGKKFREMRERVFADPRNEFGRIVIRWLEDAVPGGLPLTALREAAGLWDDRMYRLFERSNKNEPLFEPDLIYRLARHMGVSMVWLRIQYILSQGDAYTDPSYLGEYKQEEYTQEELVTLSACLEMVEQAVFHSPHLKELSREDALQQIERLTELAEAFLNIDPTMQDVLLRMAQSSRNMGPGREPKIDPKARSEGRRSGTGRLPPPRRQFNNDDTGYAVLQHYEKLQEKDQGE